MICLCELRLPLVSICRLYSNLRPLIPLPTPPFPFRNKGVSKMLKAVLKKSREGGKGSKKEPGMCTGRSWGEQAWWVWQQDPSTGPCPCLGHGSETWYVLGQTASWSYEKLNTRLGFLREVTLKLSLSYELNRSLEDLFLILEGHIDPEFQFETLWDSRCVQEFGF